jgi:hypothetical protein
MNIIAKLRVTVVDYIKTHWNFKKTVELAAISCIYGHSMLIYHGNNYLNPFNIYGTGRSLLMLRYTGDGDFEHYEVVTPCTLDLTEESITKNATGDTGLKKNIIEVTIFTGYAKGESVFIPGISLLPSDCQFEFKHLQFPH